MDAHRKVRKMICVDYYGQDEVVENEKLQLLRLGSSDGSAWSVQLDESLPGEPESSGI